MSYLTKKPDLLDTWHISRGDGGRVKVRPVRCRKAQCRSCPHAFYAYHVTGTGPGRKEKYLGTCTVEGRPRPRYE
jgi:hypothetical protein